MEESKISCYAGKHKMWGHQQSDCLPFMKCEEGAGKAAELGLCARRRKVSCCFQDIEEPGIVLMTVPVLNSHELVLPLQTNKLKE